MAEDTVQQIKELLNAEPETEPVGSAEDSDEHGHVEEAADDERESSGSRELDQPELLDAEGVEDAPEEDEEESDQPVSLKELAEKLGVESSDLYSELEIPLGDGKSASLGDIKDAFKQYGPIEEAQQKIETQKTEYEKQLLATRAELSSLMNAMPEEFRAEMIDQARRNHRSWIDQQQQIVAETIPEWKEEGTYREGREAIAALGAEFGFSKAEMDYTQDARTLKLLDSMVKMKRRLDGLETAAKKVPGKVGGKSKQRRSVSSQKKLASVLRSARESKNPTDKVAAVSMLLNKES